MPRATAAAASGLSARASNAAAKAPRPTTSTPAAWPTRCVCGPERNNTDLHDYTRHPASGAYLPDTVIPFWQEITACVSQAMDRVPGMGYVGWDIAVTPDGPELIEGNWHWPGGNIIQFDGVGKYPLLRDCAGETDEEHPH